MNALTLISTLTFCIIAAFSLAAPIAMQSQPNKSFKLNQTQQQNECIGCCTYTIIIKTSCSSPTNTRDEINLIFGDDYGNKVYVPRLDDPNSGKFNQCSTDKFEIYRPCLRPLCYLLLYRTGVDGWIPNTVTIYDYFHQPFIFHYEIDANLGSYGTDNCNMVSSNDATLIP
ncbi:embryo-specific protein ATS3B-like [Abrus precatorius]|uniref:Embryo-specific protein ATS3B-like n=1 Tax=Abrus precatorius TaxID=3816 RepID=A0A8B8KI46_ABRPR|nr:embryo-specific protein ATS3B-like [Abrus precatorius]